MNRACRDFRERLLQGLVGPPAEHPSEHVADCEACARWQRVARMHARGLAWLERISAPLELDGWTVAALHAGHRQDRAADAVASLPRAPAPDVALHDLVAEASVVETPAGVARLKAPEELDLRVARELTAPAEDRFGQHLAELTRSAAPAELDQRVAAMLRRPAPSRLSELARGPARIALAGVAGLLLLVSTYAAGAWVLGLSAAADDLSGFSFTFKRVAETTAFAPAPLSMLPLLEGGIPSETLSAAQASASSGRLKSPPPTSRRRAPKTPPKTPNGPTPPPGTSSDKRTPAAPTPPQQIVVSPIEVPHSGVKRVEAVSHVQNGRAWIQRERVHSDGTGNFTIQPLALLQPQVPQHEAQLFLDLQTERQSLNFRYRDFDINDRALFEANYKTFAMSQTIHVAGRLCAEHVIEKIELAERRYIIAVDLEFGLVLKYREETLAGVLVSSMVYEWVDFAPDHAGVTWHTPRNNENVLPPGTDLDPLLGFQAQAPRTLPPTYLLLETARVEDHLGRPWLKLTYGDGLERVFFLHGGPLTGSPFSTKWPKPDRVEVLEAVPWTSAQGNLSGHKVIAMGKVPAVDLLTLLDSSRP